MEQWKVRYDVSNAVVGAISPVVVTLVEGEDTDAVSRWEDVFGTSSS
ncbi:hypothetical protein [Haloplanus sp.]|nr:hypothetical protein [Haloplanus sp.]